MNTFKTVVMVCAMLAASCSGQYMSQSSGTQGSAGMGSQYANQGQQSAMNAGGLPMEQQRPSASPVFGGDQSLPVASPASGAVSTTQQICSCVTINPAASAPQAGAAADNSAAPQQTFAAPQQTFAAPQQTFAAPQQTFAAPQQQAYAAPQSGPAQTQGRY